MTTTRLHDIDPALVVDYDHIYGPEIMAWPPGAMDGFRETHPIFFSPRYGGFWVLTRYDDIRAVVQDAETFHQHPVGLPRMPYTKIHIPLMLDPPEHLKYRRLMSPIFAPRMIARLEPLVRGIVRDQVARIAPLGACDFVEDLCMTSPMAMFCGMLGLDLEVLPAFKRISEDLIFGAADVLAREGEDAARAFRARTGNAIDDLLKPILEDRRAHPGEDVLSILLEAKVDDRPLTDDEMLNIASLLFFAGTDSTAAIMAYSFLFLAGSPQHRHHIAASVNNPEAIAAAAQELIRYNAFHQIRRVAARDTVLLGQTIREGDIIVVPMQGANHDPRRFPDPLAVDFARPNTSAELTFSAGLHRCIGQHLATLQLRMVLEELHRVIPDYALDPAHPHSYMTSHAKTVLRHLPMVYPAA